ncbi:MAG: hypothetical protein P4M07_21310 [Xanthobacteraceae bacterium]|nr:hypothetical protein [Xanthobacteraceae bacterium]
MASFALCGFLASAAPPSYAANSLCGNLIAVVRAQSGNAEAVFIHSFAPGDFEAQLPLGLASTAFTYDNAAAAIALIACDDPADALRIGRALSLASRSDRLFHDGRIRNAYRAGPVADKTPMPPRWWDGTRNVWSEDWYQDGSYTGNAAWAALALLNLYQATHDVGFRDDAARLIDWVAASTVCGRFFCGGYAGFDDRQIRLPWISTEHNVDVAAAAGWLARSGAGTRYIKVAEQAREVLNIAFLGDHFAIGVTQDGRPAAPEQFVLDVQLWPWTALPDAPSDWRKGLAFAEEHLAVGGGFDFNSDRDGVWVEGTGQAALAYRIVGNMARSTELVKGFAADVTPGGLLNAARGVQVLTTGISSGTSPDAPPIVYHRRPQLAATAWAILAERGFNPFTGSLVK